MEVFRKFLTAASEAVTETGEQGGIRMDGMLGAMDLLLLAMLFGFGIFALYTAIRLHREQMLFTSKILYPGDCAPEDCADPGGYIDFIVPRLLLLSVAFLLMGIAMALIIYVFKISNTWTELCTVVLPIAGLIWYIVCQRKAAKLFW